MAPAAAPPTIEIHLQDLRQLFHSLDPSPFPGRDLDSDAERFLLEWAREMPREQPIAVRVHLDQAGPEEAALVTQAIHNHFHSLTESERHRLRRLLSLGWRSLLIGLAFLAVCLGAAEHLGHWADRGFLSVVREGLLIGGWVALWRPLEVFLYDWWPIVGELRLCRSLSSAPVTVLVQGTPVGV